jgi:hypothetical protein
MNRLAFIALVTVLSFTPALAVDNSVGTSGADTSTGAQQQSSAPSGSGAATDMKANGGAADSSDTSTGAKEQSSAPAGSTAATGQPNSSSATAGQSQQTTHP